MKGQAALEYLNVYVMALAVIAVGTAVSFEYLEEECVDQASGFDGEDVSLSSYTADGGETALLLEVENERFDVRDLEEVEVTDGDNQRIQSLDEEQLGPGESEVIDVSNIDQGDCDTVDVDIRTDDGTQVSGSITGNFDLLELVVPEPPEITEAEF